MSPAGASAIARVALSGGLRLVHARHGRAHAAIAVCVGSGSRADAPDREGTAHLVEHCTYLTEEGGDGEARSHSGTLSSLGAMYGAATLPDTTEFHCAMPAEQVRAVILDEGARLATAPDHEASIDRERSVIRHELAGRGMGKVVDDLWVRHLRRHDPVSHWHDGYGSAESIERVSRDDVRSFHRAHYRRDNIVVAVESDAPTDDVAEWVDHAFSSLPGSAEPSIGASSPEGTAVVLDVSGDGAGAIASASVRLDGTNLARYAAAIVSTVALQDRGIVSSVGRHGIISTRDPDLALLIATGRDPVAARDRLAARVEDAADQGESQWKALQTRAWITHRLAADNPQTRVRSAARAELLRGDGTAHDALLEALRTVPVAELRAFVREIGEAL